MTEENITQTESQEQSQTAQTTNQNENPHTQPQPVNWEEECRNNPELKSVIDKMIAQSTNTAVQNTLRKQKRLTDEKLTEAEKLQGMNDAEKVIYLERKLKEKEEKYTKEKASESLKAETLALAKEKGIPEEFVMGINFSEATADDISDQINTYDKYVYFPKGEYEIYPKGEFAKKVAAGIDEKLKQKAPENHIDNTAPKPKIPILF